MKELKTKLGKATLSEPLTLVSVTSILAQYLSLENSVLLWPEGGNDDTHVHKLFYTENEFLLVKFEHSHAPTDYFITMP